MQTIKLNDGVEIPVFRFGTFQIPADGSTYKAVREALDLSYRHIDTAAAYFNEKEVGQAVRDSGIPREEIFVTTKLWPQDYSVEKAPWGIDISLRKLDLGYIDLLLIHQPYGDVPAAWRAMEKAKAGGKVRSIGVSNMTPKIWNKFVPQFDTMPSVNQVEWNPFCQQKELRKLTDAAGTVLESWGPLGQGSKQLLEHPTITEIAAAHGKNGGQVVLRFEVQDGIIVFPKSTKPERMRSNMDIFDFSLTDDEMAAIRALDKGHGTHDPDAPGIENWLVGFDVHKGDE